MVYNKRMSIVTKRGDRGKTSLLFCGSVSKDDLRIEAIGVIDELCCFIGMSKSLLKKRSTRKLLENIQTDLFCIGAELATTGNFTKKLKRRITDGDVGFLEQTIKKIEDASCTSRCCFCIPGENFFSSCFDVSRAVARRAERLAVALFKKKRLNNRHILVYLNRLSDLLYLLARDSEKKKKLLKPKV